MLQKQTSNAIDTSSPFSKRYLEKKEALLRKAAYSILEDENYQSDLTLLRNILSLSESQIINAYVNYDLDISQNSNEMYQSLVLRYVLHMHNLLKGSWHIERQNTVLTFIKKLKPKCIVDMGFGVPSQYMKHILQNRWPCQLTLCDIDESAITFSKALFDVWSLKSWQEHVAFQKFDMNEGRVIPKQDLYIFQSSVEHVKECTSYLKKHIKNAKDDAYFLLSLPIGDITPEHYMEWKTTKAAEIWLNSCGLIILNSKLIHVNPEVDLFADYHNFQYVDFFVLCKKIIHNVHIG